MCGLVAIYNEKTPISQEKLLLATQLLKHRGPDAQNIWIAPNDHVGLGHARLSIMDLEHGTQPLHNKDLQLHAIVNGEFYDFEIIRSMLIKKGYQFFTNSDSEIILSLYHCFGLNFFNYLNGEFAFILFDEKNKLIIAARDRFGVKPLFYTQQAGSWCFASEIKALLALGISSQWNTNAVFQIFSGFALQEETCFEGIKQVKPGHCLLIDIKNQNQTTHQYWEWSFPSKNSVVSSYNPFDFIEEFERLFQQAITRRLRSDVPIACYLSGGLDSSSILSVMTENYPGKVDAFHVSFNESTYLNEYDYAHLVAKNLHITFHSIPITTQEMAKNYSNTILHTESLITNPNSIAKYLLSSKVQQSNYKVVLTGEGADEILGGYRGNYNDFIIAKSCGFFKNLTQNKLLYRKQPLNQKLRALQFLITNHYQVTKRLHYQPALFTNSLSWILLLHSVFNLQQDPQFELLNTLNCDDQISPGNSSLYLWAKSGFSEVILSALGDRVEMAHSIEARLPFLDNDLVKFATKLPDNIKAHITGEKFILKEAMRHRLPSKIVSRRKFPFAAPSFILDGNKTALYHLLDDVFSSGLLDKLPFLNKKIILNHFKNLPYAANSYSNGHLMHLVLSACLLSLNFNL
ncbi:MULTISPECIES: asparagine synthase (glutamine-hydrolyzing) [Legionella]|uniref:asparagine synthase (glutamine-hydrolyzing) n=1 Tax=Legionella TaxID=445 RepID=UPI000964AD35|nr:MULTISPECIES: asparagine synthase (glutamine-hydrolyzing) [Legionella]MBN9226243.1 asparagine synthase (glutamine-hydrolyzing) [Legionella steelei]OJW12423.1 MAG: asparagine synthase (glutamine-hydrolyzing) [Legionella sp. 39-23]